MLLRSYAALVLLGLALALALSLASSAGAITYTTLVLSGDPAPGTGGGFTTFFEPQINDGGVVVFTGSANAFTEQGIWIVDGGSVNNVMLTGTPAPGTGLTFTTTRSKIKIANDGDAGGYHRLTDMSALYDSVWRGPPGAYAAIAIDDDGASAGSFVAILNDLMMFDDGSNAFQANTITNGSLTRGNYFVSDSNSPTLVAREGLTAPGTAVAFTRVYAAAAANEVGGIVFRGELSATSDANQGVWSATEAGAVLLAREGDAVPGLGTDVFTGTAGDIAMSDSGAVAWVFTADGSVLTRGIIGGTPGNLGIIVQSGDPAPVSGEPAAVYTIFRELDINATDDIAFRSDIGGVSPTGDVGLFSIIDDTVQMVAREGDLAPGAGGALFTILERPLINDLDQIAFMAHTDAGESGLWALHGDGLELVVQSGDLFDLGGGDVREVDSVDFSASPGTQQGALGDGGTLAFQLYFTDNSRGIFAAQLTPVPEPSIGASLTAGIVTLATLARGRRRTRKGRLA